MSKPALVATGPAAVTPASDGGLTLAVPITLNRRSGRRRLVRQTEAPSGVATPLQRALARGHRWARMLETGEVASMTEIAHRESEDISYVARMLNLTLLAPDIVAAILDDALPDPIRLNALAINPPKLWDEQRRWLAITR